MDDATYGKPQVWNTSDPPPAHEILPIHVNEDSTSTEQDNSDDGNWFSRNTIDAIIVIVLSVFNLITIILLATSYRTFRTVKKYLNSRPVVRSRRANHRAAEELGVPEVFGEENMSRLHRLGDIPKIPSHLVPRFRFRHSRRGMYQRN